MHLVWPLCSELAECSMPGLQAIPALPACIGSGCVQRLGSGTTDGLSADGHLPALCKSFELTLFLRKAYDTGYQGKRLGDGEEDGFPNRYQRYDGLGVLSSFALSTG